MSSSTNPKQNRILQAATALFLENGYADTSLDLIAASAAVSKPTIYRHFGSKEALFATVVEQTCDKLARAFAPRAGGTLHPQKALMMVGYSFGEMLLDADTVAFFRMVISESHRIGSVGRRLQATVGEPWEQFLASYVKQYSARSTVAVIDPKAAARQLLGIWKEWFLWPGLLGLSNHFTAAQRKKIIARTIDSLLFTTESGKG